MKEQKYSGVILVSPDGALILQHRDDNPSIKDPNMLSIFAGKSLPNESSIEVAVREIKEETNLTLEPNSLIKLIDFRNKKKYGDIVSTIFIAKDIDISMIEVFEGQGFSYIKNHQEYLSIIDDVAPISRDILDIYYKQL